MKKDTSVSRLPTGESFEAAEPWLLLIHQLPPKPDYLRVKIWRRLQGLGAVAIKNSVYALPSTEQTREDFQWLRKEIEGAGGEASVCEARFVDGLSDGQIRDLFNAPREADYAALSEEVREALTTLAAVEIKAGDVRSRYSRMRKRFDQIGTIDFFGAATRAETAALLGALEKGLAEQDKPTAPAADSMASSYVGRTWVTRPRIGVDRMASAWLIQRFIDPAARFVFVDEGAASGPGSIRFDTATGEFTHVGDRCTFEVLLDRFQLDDKALVAIGQVIHDLDLKDGKFQSDAATGIGQVLAGIAGSDLHDEERLRQASNLFDALHRVWA